MVVNMAINFLRKPLRFGQIILNGGSHFSTSFYLTNKWRRSQGLEPNPNRFGPLTQSPDYSFVDGRPVPLSKSAIENSKLQMEYCSKIVKLCSEIDFAVERHNRLQEEEKRKKDSILSAKLKPKGHALLKTSTKKVSV